MRNITLQTNLVTGNPATTALPVSLKQLARSLDRTACTVWRWRKLGWIPEEDILNLASKPYISAAGVEKFLRRLQAGEFAQASHAPKKTKAVLA